MKRALLVESKNIHRQALRDLLSSEGFSIQEAADGQQGISAVRSSDPFDLVFLADRMPGLSGTDTLIAMRKYRPGQPVIMLMGREDRKASALALARGAADIIQKPFNSEEVLLAVRNVMEKSRLKRSGEKQFERLRLLEMHAGQLTSFRMDEFLQEDIIREDKFLKKTLHLMADVMETRKVSMMLLDKNGKELMMAQSTWMSPEIMQSIHQPVLKGVSGWVVRNGKPVLIKDVNTDKRIKLARFSKQYDSPSFVCTPLLFNKKVVGAISANDKIDGSVFTESDLAILNTFTHLLSMEIANLSVSRKIERENLKLTFINNVVFAMAASDSSEEIYQSLVDKIRTNLRANLCVLLTLEDQGDRLAICAVSSRSDVSLRPEPFAPGTGIFAKVLETGKSVKINNAMEGDGVDRKADLLGCIQADMIAAMPLKLKGSIIGILAFYDREDGRPFDDWDMEILASLAPHASMGLKNAWLYQNLTRSIDEVVATERKLDEATRSATEKTRALSRLQQKMTS
ncbi:MAG: GAF domain-containing protein [Deltaproteobacteria bacterium]|nr:GAF domain-containing protein [Deltaproteobacteria bacterium]